MSVIYDPISIFSDAVTKRIIAAAQTAFNVELDEKLVSRIVQQPKVGGKTNCDLCIPCFPISKAVGEKNGNIISEKLAKQISIDLGDDVDEYIASVVHAGPYVNFNINFNTLAKILIDSVVDGKFLEKKEGKGLDKVMVEYSQPNTHKAFHVGHMRNCALGDCLVRIYEQMGHEVVAVNYFGDEGAHIAKCLWLLKEDMMNNNVNLDDVPVNSRGEFLGNYYSKAVAKLDLSSLTNYPFPGIYSAKVISKEKHPSSEAPSNWNLCKVQLNENEIFEVVCGGSDYNVNDIVAYVPVGKVYKGNMVEPRDMKGIMSNGVIMGRSELGMKPLNNEALEETKDKETTGKKGKKKGGKKAQANVDHSIFVMESTTPIGIALTELGKLDDNIVSVDELYNSRIETVKSMLIRMESADNNDEIVQLWQKTRQWSLDEFKRIYKWLNVRFDHDFYESHVGEESRELVINALNDGILEKSNGAIVANLNKYKLGYCVLLKTSGAGLYATKDLALAQRKFQEFKVDKSVYVVDAAQTLHFQQVFKVLELLGYEQAKKCVHLPYGLVVLAHGKMSSRANSVIVFNDLVKMLSTQIKTDFIEKFANDWTQEEIDTAVQALCVAVIKYGMLNHEVNKNIVFILKDWAAKSGDTGPYMMYAYARIKSIIRTEQEKVKDVVVDYNTLTEHEKLLLLTMSNFWNIIDQTAAKNNPSTLCTFLYTLARTMSGWYEFPTSHVGKTEDPVRKATLLRFITAISLMLKKGLFLLGISTIERM